MPLVLFPPDNDGLRRKQYAVCSAAHPELNPIRRGAHYPASVDDAVLVDADPDIQYFAMETDAIPDYDPRFLTLEAPHEAIDNSASPPTWHTTYSVVKKDPTQIKFAVSNAEAAEVQKQLRGSAAPNPSPIATDTDKLVLLALGTIIAVLGKISLTEEQQAVIDKITKISSALWQNDATTKALFDQIDQGAIPDVDSPWAPVAILVQGGP